MVGFHSLLLLSCVEGDLLRVRAGHFGVPFMFSAHIRIISSPDVPGL